MSSFRVLITGGCGFIGSALIRHVLDETGFDGRLLNLDKLTYAANPEAVASAEDDRRYEFRQEDIVDLQATRRILEEFSPEILIHLAAETHVDRSIEDPFEFVRTNVLGTCNLLHAAAALSERNPGFRFVHVSTDEVYGSIDGDASAAEGDPYRPNSPYSASKAAADHMVRAWQKTYGLPAIITNCTNNYGPFQFPEKLIPVIILNAISGRPVPVYGDGGNVRDWLFVEDHARAIWLAAQSGAVGETYNVSGRSEKANLDVVETICRLLDERCPREDGRAYAEQIRFVTDRPGHDRRYSLDSSRIEAELGWRPAMSFEEGIARTVDWYVARADRYLEQENPVFARRRG
jgi:dTDP-glucose 4,6-dehydratase